MGFGIAGHCRGVVDAIIYTVWNAASCQAWQRNGDREGVWAGEVVAVWVRLPAPVSPG